MNAVAAKRFDVVCVQATIFAGHFNGINFQIGFVYQAEMFPHDGRIMWRVFVNETKFAEVYEDTLWRYFQRAPRRAS